MTQQQKGVRASWSRSGARSPIGRRRIFVFAALLVVALCVPAVAISDDSASPTVAATAQALTGTDTVQASADVQSSSDADSAVVANTGGTSVDIPTDPSASVVLDPAAAAPISIGIPGGDQAANAASVANGVVAYTDAAPDTTVVAQALPAGVDGSTEADASAASAAAAGDDTSSPAIEGDSGGVRLMTVIDGPSAPTTFAFPLDLPAGATLAQNGNGYVISDATGTPIAAISAPWATDANDAPVPASYSLDGNTLVLHVDHQGAAYPVVADPTVSDCGFTGCWVDFN